MGRTAVDPSVETAKKRDSCGWLLRPRRLIENKPATSAITSLRDDEVTERCHGYQNYFFSRSLFQLKDEPERAGIRRLRKAPFILKLDRDYQPQGGGNVGIAERFPRAVG